MKDSQAEEVQEGITIINKELIHKEVTTAGLRNKIQVRVTRTNFNIVLKENSIK